MSAKKSTAKAPVVMIHGAFTGPWIWDGFAEKFRAAGYAVHAPCLRHHDRPSDELGQTSLNDYAHDLDAFIETLEGEPVLVGHAMGGLLAQKLAARRGIRALILLAPSPPWGVAPSSLFEISSAQAMLLNVGFWNSSLAAEDHILSRHGLDRLPQAARDAVLARLGPESGRAIFEVMHWGLDMSRAGEVDAAEIACPLLLVVGSEDRIHPPGTVERIAALYGGQASFEKIPRMSHWLPGEPGWENVADCALSWLDELSDRRG